MPDPYQFPQARAALEAYRGREAATLHKHKTGQFGTDADWVREQAESQRLLMVDAYAATRDGRIAYQRALVLLNDAVDRWRPLRDRLYAGSIGEPDYRAAAVAAAVAAVDTPLLAEGFIAATQEGWWTAHADDIRAIQDSVAPAPGALTPEQVAALCAAEVPALKQWLLEYVELFCG